MSSLMTILLLWVTDLQKDRVKNKKEGGLSSFPWFLGLNGFLGICRVFEQCIVCAISHVNI